VFFFSSHQSSTLLFSNMSSGQRLSAHTPLAATRTAFFFSNPKPRHEQSIQEASIQSGRRSSVGSTKSHSSRQSSASFSLISIARPRQQSAFSIPAFQHPFTQRPADRRSRPQQSHSTFVPRICLPCSLLSETSRKPKHHKGEGKQTVAKPGQPREKKEKDKKITKEKRGKGVSQQNTGKSPIHPRLNRVSRTKGSERRWTEVERIGLVK